MRNIISVYVVLVLCAVGVDLHKKINVAVYYESACPDSKNFILKQLRPTIRQFAGYVELQLIPFGKASSINNGAGGFECQHGKTECLGNLIQDCALDSMKSRSGVEKTKYVACEMETFASTKGDLQCTERSQIPYEDIHQCVYSDKGKNLQLQSEYLTKLIRPKFIPTIVFDGVFNQQTQNNAFNDLKGTLCSKLGNIEPCVSLLHGK